MIETMKRFLSRKAVFFLVGWLITALAAPSGVLAQMSLPSPSDDYSLPARKDSLWDGFNVVVIDPGHGGEDIGAAGPEGLTEKDFTLKLALKIERTLVDRLGLVVYLTREKDVSLHVIERTASANNRNADLMISLHSGAGFGRETSRTVRCYYIEDPPATEEEAKAQEESAMASWRWNTAHRTHVKESAEFAKILAGKVGPVFKGEALSVPGGLLKVLQGASMPAVLVETGTITAPSDEAVLRKEETISALSGSITEAVIIFKRRLDEITPKPAQGKN